MQTTLSLRKLLSHKERWARHIFNGWKKKRRLNLAIDRKDKRESFTWYMNPYEKCCLSLTKELELLAVGRKVGTSSKLLWLNDENSIFWFWNGQRLSGDQATKRPGMCKYSLSDVFPGGSDSKASACNAGDPGLIPGSGRSPGEGNDTPLQYSCLENPMDGGAWWATVHRVTKNWTQLSNFTLFEYSHSIISKSTF